MSSNGAHLWVVVSSIDQGVKTDEMPAIISRITALVDKWHSEGKMMLSGPFDNEISSMTVISATASEAQDLFKQWNDICSGFLVSEMYRWDAMPVLSVLAK